VARAQLNGVTYIYFEILLVCSLVWEKTFAVVDLLVVDATRWNKDRRRTICGARASDELVGMIVKW
jgi:hypothetical protein